MPRERDHQHTSTSRGHVLHDGGRQGKRRDSRPALVEEDGNSTSSLPRATAPTAAGPLPRMHRPAAITAAAHPTPTRGLAGNVSEASGHGNGTAAKSVPESSAGLEDSLLHTGPMTGRPHLLLPLHSKGSVEQVADGPSEHAGGGKAPSSPGHSPPLGVSSSAQGFHSMHQRQYRNQPRQQSEPPSTSAAAASVVPAHVQLAQGTGNRQQLQEATTAAAPSEPRRNSKSGTLRAIRAPRKPTAAGTNGGNASPPIATLHPRRVSGIVTSSGTAPGAGGGSADAQSVGAGHQRAKLALLADLSSVSSLSLYPGSRTIVGLHGGAPSAPPSHGRTGETEREPMDPPRPALRSQVDLPARSRQQQQQQRPHERRRGSSRNAPGRTAVTIPALQEAPTTKAAISRKPSERLLGGPRSFASDNGVPATRGPPRLLPQLGGTQKYRHHRAYDPAQVGLSADVLSPGLLSPLSGTVEKHNSHHSNSGGGGDTTRALTQMPTWTPIYKVLPTAVPPALHSPLSEDLSKHSLSGSIPWLSRGSSHDAVWQGMPPMSGGSLHGVHSVLQSPREHPFLVESAAPARIWKPPPWTPAEAISMHKHTVLTMYEEREIESYAEVFYCGSRAVSMGLKRVDAVFGGQEWDSYFMPPSPSASNLFASTQRWQSKALPSFPPTPAAVAAMFDDEDHNYRICLGDHIAFRYEVVDVLGYGTYSFVVRAIDHGVCRSHVNGGCGICSGEVVHHGHSITHPPAAAFCAMKIIRSEATYTEGAEKEVRVLEKINSSIAKRSTLPSTAALLSHFSFRGHKVLVFPLFGMDLGELLRVNGRRSLPPAITRSLSAQLLWCLHMLHDHAAVIHADVKLENIVLVDRSAEDNEFFTMGLLSATGTTSGTTRTQSSYWQLGVSPDDSAALYSGPVHGGAGDVDVSSHVTLIDYSNSKLINWPRTYPAQSPYYRAPEVSLKLPYGTAIDMWSVGCAVFELATGCTLFPHTRDIELLDQHLTVLGLPDREFLDHVKVSWRAYKAAHPYLDRRKHGDRRDSVPAELQDLLDARCDDVREMEECWIAMLAMLASKSAEVKALSPGVGGGGTLLTLLGIKEALDTLDVRSSSPSSLPEVDAAVCTVMLLDFLLGCLYWSAGDRLTAAEATHHPYVAAFFTSPSTTTAATGANKQPPRSSGTYFILHHPLTAGHARLVALVPRMTAGHPTCMATSEVLSASSSFSSDTHVVAQVLSTTQAIFPLRHPPSHPTLEPRACLPAQGGRSSQNTASATTATSQTSSVAPHPSEVLVIPGSRSGDDDPPPGLPGGAAHHKGDQDHNGGGAAWLRVSSSRDSSSIRFRLNSAYLLSSTGAGGGGGQSQPLYGRLDHHTAQAEHDREATATSPMAAGEAASRLDADSLLRMRSPLRPSRPGRPPLPVTGASMDTTDETVPATVADNSDGHSGGLPRGEEPLLFYQDPDGNDVAVISFD